jgi:large conductance mechanosensitive channel
MPTTGTSGLRMDAGVHERGPVAVEAALSTVNGGFCQNSVMRGFRSFLMRGNLVNLAVAFVVGAAFTAVVTALVTDLLTPLIAAVVGKPSFPALSFTVNHSRFLYGAFINALLVFVFMAAVIYFLVVAPMARLIAFQDRNKAATTRTCPQCLSDIPVMATRCKYCTGDVAPVMQTAPDRRGRHHGGWGAERPGRNGERNPGY